MDILTLNNINGGIGEFKHSLHDYLMHSYKNDEDIVSLGFDCWSHKTSH